jgi:hypothetical protein
LASMFEPPCVIAGLDDLAVMRHPVQKRRGHLGVAKDLAHRLVFEGRTLDIEAVLPDERKSRLVIMCTEQLRWPTARPTSCLFLPDKIVSCGLLRQRRNTNRLTDTRLTPKVPGIPFIPRG